jgi:hypothetical protein
MVKERGRSLKKEPAMLANIIYYILAAAVAQVAANPVSSIYLGLSIVHLIAMRCYLSHQDARTLAICAGMAGIFYCALAFLHGFAH